jgi:hypothetical protein
LLKLCNPSDKRAAVCKCCVARQPIQPPDAHGHIETLDLRFAQRLAGGAIGEAR